MKCSLEKTKTKRNSGCVVVVVSQVGVINTTGIFGLLDNLPLEE